MKNIIRKVTKFICPEEPHLVTYAVTVDAFEMYCHRELIEGIVNQISEAVAKAYVEQHGEEILKHLNAKTIDAKVIQKVITNVRKELKGEPR